MIPLRRFRIVCGPAAVCRLKHRNYWHDINIYTHNLRRANAFEVQFDVALTILIMAGFFSPECHFG